MKPERLFCQDCGLKYDNLSSYKTHALGNSHQKKVAEVFQIVPHNGQVNFPHLTMEYLSRPNRSYPVIGLQLMSLCISTAMDGVPFYLCHACQEKCQSSAVLSHLISTEHYFSVFAYMNPEQLNFGWFHPPQTVPGLRAKAVEEEKQQGPGVLRVIDIPKKVFENMKMAPYFQIMKELTHSDKLKEIFRVDKPERMTLQEYLRNPVRTHPLLGLNFLVEYKSIDSSKLCGYLCLLCKKRVRETQVIAHVIGFNHFFWYLDRLHPSSLYSKSTYNIYTEKCRLQFLDLAKQAQEIGTSGDVQEMKLDPEDFAVANSGSFANALELLQVIRKQESQSDLRPHVTPGRTLETAQSPETSRLEPVADQQNKTEPDKAGQWSAVVSKSGGNPRLSCLVCAPGALFLYMSEYKKHVRGNKHQQRMEFLFQTELHRTTVPVPSMVVYEYIVNPHRTDPVIGLQLVTACIETELVLTPLYLCHTCQDKCSSHVIVAHLTSSNHYFSTLAFMDPERLHFGWIPSQDMLSILRPQALAVENQHGSGMLQVLEMPKNFNRMIATTPYLPAMKSLCQTTELNERLRAKKWITLATYLTNPNRKHPMLGLNFLVEYTCKKYHNLCGYLCLLCKKKVRETLVIAHIIGFDHLFCYLDLSHPSSLGSKSLYKHYDAQYNSMILDLATQAEKMDSSGKVQQIALEPAVYDEVDSTEFFYALNKLQMVWGETNQSNIEPLMTPGPRLVRMKQTKAPSTKPKKLAQSSEPQNTSQSSDLLWTYLKKKERREPIIGLSAVIECSTDNLPPYYLCEACAEKVSQDRIIDHLISPTHRYCYLKLQHLLSHWEEMPDLTKNIGALKERAAALEQEKGFGEAQVLELDPTQYKDIVSSSIDVALNSLRTIQEEKRQSCLQPLLIPGQGLVTVKEEMVQSQVTPQTLDQVSECTVIQKTVKIQGIAQEPALDLKHTEKSFYPGQTQVSKVLDHYLNSKLRKEPVIGLDGLFVYHGDNQPDFLECNTCSKRLPINCIIGHFIGARHRFAYIKSKYPSLLVGWRDQPSLTQNIHKLKVMAKSLEKVYGCGQFKVLKAGQDSVSEVGPTSTCKAATKKSPVTPQVPVEYPKSTEVKMEYPLQKLGASPDFTVPQGKSEFSQAISKKKKKKKKWRKSLVIGLREVTECSSANQDTIYFCNICRAKISKFHIFYHVVGLQHHYNYIKAYYPSLLKGQVKQAHLPSMSKYLLKLANIVKEKERGVGDVQVMKLDVELYKKLTSMSADSAVNNLQIWKEQSQNKDQTELKGMKDLQHSLEPPPKQPCLPKPHEGAAKNETEKRVGSSEASVVDDFRVPPETDADKEVQIQATLQNPECIEPNTVTVKQKVESPACPEEHLQVTQQGKQYRGRQDGNVKHDLEPIAVTVKQELMESQVCSEEPIQDPQHIDTKQATNAKEVVPSSVAAQKPIQGPKLHDTPLFTVRENLTQSPTPPEQSVPGLKSAEIKQVISPVSVSAAVEQVEIHAGLQNPEFTEATTASRHEEKVCWQMTSCISFQDPRMSAAKRVDIPVGESHLSKFMLSFMTGKREPLIGLGAVVECRSFKQPTFYLCLTCTMKIHKNCICNHIIGVDHQHYYIESLYPDLISDWMKNPTDVAWLVEGHEKIWDVQVMKLDLNLYEEVAAASFDLALAQLQVVRRKNNQSYLRPLVTSGQRLIIVHNWGVPHQQAPGKLHQDPSTTESQRVCVSEKRVQSPGCPEKPPQDLKEVERQSGTNGVETAKHGGAQQEPEEELQNADQAKAVNAEGVAQASQLEPWPRLKGTEKVPVERACRSFLDLRAFVEDPQRTQPVVGLNALIECRSEKQPLLYLCVACSTQLNKTPVICHIISNKHRLSYLGSRRPDLFMGWNNSQDSAKMFSNLMEIAREVESEEQSGVREIQEVSLDSAAYTDVKSVPFDKALNLLQTICKEQGRGDLQTFVTPGQRLLTVKQEQMECQACPEQPSQVPQHIDTEQSSAGEEKLTLVETVTHQERQSDSGAKTPVIGLQLVIECRNVEGRPPPCFYLCQACSVKLTGDHWSINKHLTSAQHQYFYIKSCHPSRLEMEKAAGRIICGMTDLVQFVAKKLEEEEGSGSFQVMNISEGIYEKLKQGNYEDCMKMLKGCVDENQTCRKIREGNIQHTDSTGVTLSYLTAPWGPGKTLQSSGPTSYVSHDSPTTLSPPIVSGQRLWPDHLESPGDLAAHRPSTATSCPSNEDGSSWPLAPHQLDHSSHRTSKPWSLNSLSPTRPAYSPRDTLSHRPAVATELSPVRAANRHHPSQSATSSRATSIRRSGANKDVVQGEQISTVGHLLSPVEDKGLSTTEARKRKHHREESGDEAPWNYENRQFSFSPCQKSVSQSKRSRGVHDPRVGAPDLHLSDRALRTAVAETHRASGQHSNIVIGPCRVGLEKESPSSRGGLERGSRKSILKWPTSSEAIRDSDSQSSSEGLKKDLATTAHPVSAAAGRGPQTVSHLRKSTQHKETDGTTIWRQLNSDSPPGKIPGLDLIDSQESPAERLLTCWKTIIGGGAMKPDAYKPRAMESNYTDNKDTGNQSHFSKSIILYINNKSRMQPIVGLNTIIECCHNTQPPFYLCKACSVRMTKGGIRSHIMGSFHRFSYIKSQHPDLLSSLKEKTDLTKMAWPLMEIARVLEEKEGVGEVQVLKMGDTLYKEMLFSTFADALSKLLLIQKQQNQHDLQTLVTPEQGLASHVEEPVQMALRDPKQNPRSTERGTHAKMVTQVVSGPQKTGLRSKLIMALRETATRPVIGLRSITECRLFNHPTFYLCAVCSARILKKDILDHIYNSLHRYKYIKFHHAHLLRGFLETAGHKKRVRIINAIAKTVGMEEGMGVVQVIRLRPALYWKMFTHSPVAALSCLQMIQKEWNLKKDITDQRSAIALKHSSPSFSPEPTPKQPCLPNTPDALVPPQKERIQGERVSVPGEARGGASVEVKMVEPMVGLQLVIECRSVEEQQPPYYYLCQACSIKLTGDQQSINKHLSSPQHRYNYINSHRPELLGAKKRTAGLHGTAYILRTMAEELEKEEGSGEIQVIKLSACIYGEVAERNYQWCMKMLKCSENCQTNDKSGEMNIMQHAEARIPLVATKRCTPGLSQQTHGPSAKKERVDAQSASMGCKEPLKDLPIRISHIVGRHAREHFLPDPSPKSYHIPPNSLCDSLTKPSRGPNHCMSHRLPPPKRLSHTLVAPSGPVFNITLPLAKGQLLVQRAPFNTQPSDPDWTLCPETPEVDLDPQFTSHNNGDLTPESPLEDLPPMFPGPSQAYVDSQEALSLCELAQDQSIIVSLEAHRAPTSPSESHLPLPSQAQRECSDPAGRDWLPTGHSVVIDSYEGRLLDLLMEEILEECEVNSEMAERLRLHVHANTPEPGESCRAGVEVQSRSFDSGTHCDSLDPAQGEAVPSGGRCQEDLGYEDPWSYEDRQFAPDPWNLSL